MKNYAKSRYRTLEEDLELFLEMGVIPAKMLNNVLSLVRNSMDDLRSFLKDNPFLNKEEEIAFFKYDKPRFLAWHIYALEMFKIETNRPAGDDLSLKRYYEQELQMIQRYFRQYRFQYQYYLLGGDEFDQIYFIRGGHVPSLLLPNSIDNDPAFTTPCDYLFASFIAYDKLSNFLAANLFPDVKASLFKKGAANLKWTGDKTNLIELAYAIHDTAQINNGEADLWEIISWFEQTLNVSLNRYYKVFSEIKSRKSVSKTRYLDHMRAMLLQHIEDGDAFQPQSPRPVSGSKSTIKK